MKKAILCAVALMFGTMAYAQVSGAPVATQVPALAGAAAGANTGESIQNGNDNKVRVQQAGTSQSVYTNQNDGSTGVGGNLAKVRQTGAVQPGISGELNFAEVLQSGEANQSQTRQEGDTNNATTRQGQNDPSSLGNKAKIRQGTGQQAQDNFAAIEQDGTGNQAQTQQTYDNNAAWTRQVGTTNKSMINQDAGPNQTDGHEAMVEQYGTSNESFIDQEGAGGNTATAYQEGTTNQAKQYQTTTAASGSSMGNDAKVKQGGDGNLLVPVSLDLYNRIANDVFDVRTYGTQNLGPAHNNDALQVQSGKLQEAEIAQYNSDNYAEQRQSGWGHDAMIVQNARGAGGDNYAKQEQRGDLNTAGLVQAGSDNKAYQYQQNRLNDVLSTQNGDENLLNTHQFGNENRITSAQHGDNNTALLVQRGGQSFVAQQNLDGMGGGNNQIDSLQLGPDGDFGTDGVDCMFMPEVDLNMNYDIPDFDLDPVCPGC